MNSKIGLIIRREYLERVKKKSFIITTLLMPIVMVGLMLIPALVIMFADGHDTRVGVIDDSKKVVQYLESTDNMEIVPLSETLDSARKNEKLDAVLLIPANILDEGATVQLFSNEASSMVMEQAITSQINSAIEKQRMAAYNIDGLDKIMNDVRADVTLKSFRNDEGDESRESSTTLSYALGVGLTFMLYMCLLLYGQMVMTSIIEEKNNRVLEIVVSSVKPTSLMLGKICGIGLVAVTQILIWGILITGISAFVLPALVPEATGAEAAMAASGADMSGMAADTEMLSALSMLGNVGYIIQLFTLLLLFLIGGFMLYSALYAAIGSAVDNIQDAGQLQSVVVIPIIIGIAFGMVAAADPNSGVAFWASMIPFTSPMVMMARVPFGIPAWEIALSLVLLYASFFAMVWLAAKIYRVGIFMYGKKPTLKELLRWARYK